MKGKQLSASIFGLLVVYGGTAVYLSADSVGDLNIAKPATRTHQIASPGRTATASKEQPSAPVGGVHSKVATEREAAIDWQQLDEAKAIAVQECIVRFGEEVDVPTTEAGLIAELSVNTGDTIQWGDPLARLDDRALRIRSHAANLRLESANQQTADDLELQYAETALQEAQAELDASRSIQKDSAGAVPLTTLRRLRLSVERAELEVARAKKAASLAKIEIDLRAADVSTIEETLRRLQLQSPLAGVVLQVFHERGEWLNTGEAVVRVARLDRLDVHALLAADQLSPQACSRQAVEVRWTDAATNREHRLRGRVTGVQPQRVAGSRYRIEAEVENQRLPDNQSWLLYPGTEVRMFVYPESVK